MITIETSIVRHVIIAKNTSAITFHVGGEFTFTAGQYVTLILPTLSHLVAREQFRDFSIASSPTELPLLTIAFRLSSSAFKQTLMALAPGEHVTMQGPKGIFLLPNDARQPIVCIAGGIGITPFRSVMRCIVDNKLSVELSLVYCNRNSESAPFLDEMEGYIPTPRFHCVFGQLTKEAIVGASGVGDKPLYYVAGPPGMIKTAREILAALLVSDEYIHTEEFTGYE